MQGHRLRRGEVAALECKYGRFIMVGRFLAFAVVAVCSTGVAHAGPRAVVELFTSQGCSSCPPADKVLGELAADPSIVAISAPIDYWDYLGWKDTLAEPQNTARQKAYAYARGDGQVYTPQVVVNGMVHVVGSDKSAIEYAIAKSRANGAVSSPPVTLAFADGHLKVAVGDAPEGHPAAEVWLCGLTRAVTIAIGRGENTGRSVTYHNVVRSWVKLGSWTGAATSWSVPTQALKREGSDEVAVLVQSGTTDRPRAIVGASLAAIQ
jgi:hypothetical protein